MCSKGVQYYIICEEGGWKELWLVSCKGEDYNGELVRRK